jgi:hypothetical protein
MIEIPRQYSVEVSLSGLINPYQWAIACRINPEKEVLDKLPVVALDTQTDELFIYTGKYDK